MILKTGSCPIMRGLLACICFSVALSGAALVAWGSIYKADKQSVAQASLNQSNTTSRRQKIGRLEPGKSIERKLAGGELHSYPVMLETGQFLHAVVEQKGIDVVVTLRGPDGNQIVEVDSPNGAQGPEPVFAIAEAGGSYRLEIRSLEKEAQAGRYEAKIEERRRATPQDKERVAAQKQFLEGLKLQLQWTAESLREAVNKYQQSLNGWRAVGDRRREAATLSGLGKIYLNLGETKKALDCFLQELSLRQTIDDLKGKAEMLTNIGVAYDSLGDPQNALKFYNQALPLFRTVGDLRGEAITLNNIGVVYESLGDRQEALAFYNQVLRLSRAVGDRGTEAMALNEKIATYRFTVLR